MNTFQIGLHSHNLDNFRTKVKNCRFFVYDSTKLMNFRSAVEINLDLNEHVTDEKEIEVYCCSLQEYVFWLQGI